MHKNLYLLLFVLATLLVACKDDSVSSGQGVLSPEDEVVVKVDTFDLRSALRMSPQVISLPDSMLVGELETSLGTMRASALTQLCCPLGFAYPDNAEIDSVCLQVYYRSWVGDGLAPLALNVYQLDGEVMPYMTPKDDPYVTDFDISRYCSMADSTRVLSHERIVVADRKTDSLYSSTSGAYSACVRFRLTKEFQDRFMTLRNYKQTADGREFTQKDFNEFFKGLLITSDYGSSTMLNLTDVSVGVYYHFSYTRLGKDTTVSDMKAYYSNVEVRQLNHIEYANKEALLQELAKTDTSYIIAPAGVYTSLKLPMGKMKHAIMSELGDKRPYVNKAQIRVDIIPVEQSGREQWLQPAREMLLIKDDGVGRIENFFASKEQLTDTVGVLSALTTGLDSLGNNVQYYSFDISALLTQQLRDQSEALDTDTLCMTLVPVENLRQQQTPSATLIRSAQSAYDRMTLKVVYSGF